MLHRSVLMLAATALFAGFPLTGEAAQIAPNPNPAGSTIDIVNDPTAFNALTPFTNAGTINIDAVSTLTNQTGAQLNNAQLTNSGTFVNQTGAGMGSSNGGSISNSGTFINNGGISIFSGSLGLTSSGTVINTGLISGFVIGISTSGTFTNSGTLNIAANGSLGNSGSLMNTGTIDLGDGTQIGNSGTFTNAGNMSFFWFMENHGQLVNTGSLAFTGQLSNDSMIRNAGSLTISSNGIVAPEFGLLGNSSTGTLVNEAGSALTVTGHPTQTFAKGLLSNGGTMINEAGSVQTITQFGRLTNTGTITHAGELTNNGHIQNGFMELETDGSGNILKAHSGVLTNTGTILGSGSYTQVVGHTINNGTLTQLGGVNIQSGMLSGLGTITTPTLTIGASLNPGTTTQLGTLTLNGDLQHSSGGILNFRLGGLNSGEFDVLKINGNATFSPGHVVFSFVNGFTAAVGNSWKFLTASALAGWDNLVVVMSGLAAGLGYQITTVDGAQTLTITNTPVSVPEPGSLLLLGAGLAGLIGLRRKIAKNSDQN